MAVKTAQELVEAATKLLGDNTSDDALSFLEDINDSYGSDGTDWKAKYEQSELDRTELDKSWRQRYRARFLDPMTSTDNDDDKDKDKDDNDDDEKEVTFDDLFTEGKEK
jgi:hypothetical protein